MPVLPEERATLYPVQVSGLFNALCLATTPSLHSLPTSRSDPGCVQASPRKGTLPKHLFHLLFPFSSLQLTSYKLQVANTEPLTQHITFPLRVGEEQVLVHRATTIVSTSASLSESGIVTCSK